MAAPANNDGEDIIKICKELMTCDSEDCNNKNPQGHCSRCHMVYYCGKSCQKEHWQVHKEDCIPIDTMRSNIAGIGKGPLPMIGADKETTERVLKEDNPECAICFSSDKEMVNPIVLDGCHHAFCFSCLKSWCEQQTKMGLDSWLPREKNKSKVATCPICRVQIPDLAGAVLGRAFLHIEVAKKQATSKEEREKRCAQAAADVEKLIGDRNQEKLTLQERLNFGYLRAEIAILVGDYDSALEILRDLALDTEKSVERGSKLQQLMSRAGVLRQDERNDDEVLEILNQVILLNEDGHSEPTSHVDLCLKIAQVQILKEDWGDAQDTYQGILRKYPKQEQIRAQQERAIYVGFSQCCYQMGEYEMATSLGEGAIEMNRYYPWVHKFVALAYKAQGKTDQAKQVAAEAVVYETPWDDTHMKAVRDFYNEHFLSVA